MDEVEITEEQSDDMIIRSLTVRCVHLEKQVQRLNEKARLANQRADNFQALASKAQSSERIYRDGWAAFEKRLNGMISSTGFEVSKNTLWTDASGNVRRRSE